MNYLVEVWVDDPIFVTVEYEGDYEEAKKKVREALGTLHRFNHKLSIPMVQKATISEETQCPTETR